ncbi:Protein of unknown function DUF2344 [Desulforamulus ruminis DSM 2154]|uniref:DUF2344 domain-containing protein n=1 Tax=Desulforamulus ruminis (strain ATCC 23193 / DSM 2154 / NCIMB 8452 / DL) TaxID=696281 RepID=F6DL84_DESRL|nr:Protein of unknown function DUF2344 [Desulforamulus ruminis DSM 2154]
MPRYRVKYSKEGPARYSSHLDMVRAFDRSTRRAGLPVAFSEGFNPHPKFSFASPLPVGIGGGDEYMDMELTRAIAPEELAERLEANMQEGYRVIAVKEIPQGSPALMSLISRAAYRATAPLPLDYAQAELSSAVQNILNFKEIMVTREIKGRRKEIDIRPGLFSLTGRIKEHILEINMELLIGSSGNVRPTEILWEMSRSGGIPLLPEDFRVQRTALYANGPSGPVSLWEV